MKKYLFIPAAALFIAALSFNAIGTLLTSDAIVSRALAQAGQIITGGIISGKLSRQGATPTVTSGALTAGSTDFYGEVTPASQSVNTVITFSSAWSVAPVCIVSAAVDSRGLVWSVSTTALTITASGNYTVSTKIAYLCIGIRN